MTPILNYIFKPLGMPREGSLFRRTCRRSGSPHPISPNFPRGLTKISIAYWPCSR